MNSELIDTAPNKFFRRVFKRGYEAVIINKIPMVVIWLVAVTLILTYYNSERVFSLFKKVETVKSNLGFAFSIFSTAFFGAVVPHIFLLIRGGKSEDTKLSHLIFYFCYWGYRGFEIDLFYRFQAWMFGTGSGLSVLIPKVFVDQFLYSPLIAVPGLVILYAWKDQDFPSLKNFKFKFEIKNEQLFAVMIMNWVIWLPTVAILYCFPLSLQLPIQNLMLSLSCLLFILLAKSDKKHHKQNS